MVEKQHIAVGRQLAAYGFGLPLFDATHSETRQAGGAMSGRAQRDAQFIEALFDFQQ
jgi:hypothetical protein